MISKKKRLDPHAEFANSLPDEFLACRKWGHAWNPSWRLYQGDGELQGCMFRIIDCARCTMIRIDVYDLGGKFIARRYRTPYGYRSKGCRLDGQDIEEAVLARSTTERLSREQQYGVGARPRTLPAVK